MPTTRLAAWVAAVALAAPLHQLSAQSACNRDEWNMYSDDARGHYCEVRVERIPRPSGPLDIDARPNGSIHVHGVDGDSIVLTEQIETIASTDSDAHTLASQVRVITSGASIHAEGPDTHHHIRWFVTFRVTVPTHTDLALDSENGGIRVANVTGHMRLTTENGAIALDGVGGDVQARGQNGPLDITLTGPRWSGAGLDAETENGPVVLTVPKNYAAHLETGTVNGPMDIDLPITVQGHIDLRHFSTDIGGGGPPVRAVTTNGPVSVQRD